jgi:hypothetical protein
MFSPNGSLSPVPAWANELKPGDVVLFRFPCAEEAPAEEPKSRACLVLNTEKRGDRRIIELAYGTSVDTDANVGDEIHVCLHDEMKAACVKKPTRFVCARRITVSFDHHGWDINPKFPSPLIGHLALRSLERMNAIRAKIDARRHFAGAYTAARSRDFVVEHRRPRRLKNKPQEFRA